MPYQIRDFSKRNFRLHGYPRLKCRFSGHLNFLTCQMKCYFSCFRILRFKKEICFGLISSKSEHVRLPPNIHIFSQLDVRRFNFSPIKDIIVKSLQIFLIQEIYIFLIFFRFSSPLSLHEYSGIDVFMSRWVRVKLFFRK